MVTRALPVSKDGPFKIVDSEVICIKDNGDIGDNGGQLEMIAVS